MRKLIKDIWGQSKNSHIEKRNWFYAEYFYSDPKYLAPPALQVDVQGDPLFMASLEKCTDSTIHPKI